MRVRETLFVDASVMVDRRDAADSEGAVALYLNRRLHSQGIHDLHAVNYCTEIVDYCT